MKDKIRKNSLNLVSITMRQKINLLITVFSISLLFLSSCEKEIYDDAIYKSQQPQNLSISKISFKELKSNKKAVQKIKNVMTKKLPSSLSQRAVYNEDFGVLIDTTNIVQMVSETEQSLTFNIVDYTDSTKKENLILVSKDDGSFEAYIAEYNLTQQDLDILASGGTLENLQPTNISEIENASKIAVSGSCVMTSTYTVGMCKNANGDIIINNGNIRDNCEGDWFDVEYQVISIDYSCISQGGGSLYTGSGISSESSGSGSNSNSGSGYSGGSGYNGSFSGNYINTTFVPCTSCIEFTETLSNFLSNLSNDQLSFWNNLDNITRQNIVNYLNQPINDPVFVEELIDLARQDLVVDTNAINFTLRAKIQNKIENDLDEVFLLSVDQYVDLNTSDPIVTQQLITYFSVKCAILRHQNPTWSNAKIYWEASKDLIHVGLDIFGLVPLIGELADLTNGVLYTIEGDGVNATLS